MPRRWHAKHGGVPASASQQTEALRMDTAAPNPIRSISVPLEANPDFGAPCRCHRRTLQSIRELITYLAITPFLRQTKMKWPEFLRAETFRGYATRQSHIEREPRNCRAGSGT